MAKPLPNTDIPDLITSLKTFGTKNTVGYYVIIDKEDARKLSRNMAMEGGVIQFYLYKSKSFDRSIVFFSAFGIDAYYNIIPYYYNNSWYIIRKPNKKLYRRSITIKDEHNHDERRFFWIDSAEHNELPEHAVYLFPNV